MHFNAKFLVFLTFFESLKVFLINMVATLMISAELVTLGLLNRKVYSSKGYDVKIFVLDVTKNLSRDSKYIIDGVM